MTTDRLKIDKTKDELVITINAFSDKGKQNGLLLWIVLFSLCGVAIISQFFGDYDTGTKIFFGVYVAFWLFFEFKVIYAYRWRKSGVERIIFNNENVILVKEIGKRGITHQIPLKGIENLRAFENKDNDFIKSMTNSYWNINKYTLVFDYQGTMVPFAIDLIPKDAKIVLREIKEYLNKEA